MKQTQGIYVSMYNTGEFYISIPHGEVSIHYTPTKSSVRRINYLMSNYHTLPTLYNVYGSNNKCLTINISKE